MKTILLVLVSLLGAPHYKTRDIAQEQLTILNNEHDLRLYLTPHLYNPDPEISRRINLILDDYYSVPTIPLYNNLIGEKYSYPYECENNKESSRQQAYDYIQEMLHSGVPRKTVLEMVNKALEIEID